MTTDICRWCGRPIEPMDLSSTGWTHSPMGGIACAGPGESGLLRFPDYLAEPSANGPEVTP